MNRSEEILNELKSISPRLASMEKINVFQVPEGYFNELHLRLTNYVIINNISSTDNINKINFQQVPLGYFDTLSDSILARVKAAYCETADEELRKLSSLLYSLKNENVFSVPAGYFESLSNVIVEKVNQPSAKIISISRGYTWWKYAAAAVITGIIAVGSFQIFNKFSNGHSGNSPDSSSDLPGYVQNSFQYKTEEDINAGIAKLSDADIVNYLEKNGNVMDNSLLMNNTDVSEMPNQTDYLKDENTLNDYLDKIDAKNN